MVTKNDFKVAVMTKGNIKVSVRDPFGVTGFQACYELTKLGYKVETVRFPQRH
jgi:hypothetical protein